MLGVPQEILLPTYDTQTWGKACKDAARLRCRGPSCTLCAQAPEISSMKIGDRHTLSTATSLCATFTTCRSAPSSEASKCRKQGRYSTADSWTYHYLGRPNNAEPMLTLESKLTGLSTTGVTAAKKAPHKAQHEGRGSSPLLHLGSGVQVALLPAVVLLLQPAAWNLLALRRHGS